MFNNITLPKPPIYTDIDGIIESLHLFPYSIVFLFLLYAIVKTWRPEYFSIGLRFKLLAVMVRNPTNLNTIVNY